MPVSSSTPVVTPGTIVCPHLDVPHQPGMNLVWSAALELAWKRLMKQAGGPIELAGVAPDDPAARLVRILNESPIEEGMLPREATVAWAGRADERGAGELRREIERVFGPAEARRVDVPDVSRITVVGGLDLHPQFTVPFARRTRTLAYRDKYAQAFGMWFDKDEPSDVWQRRSAQVVVHFPRYADDELAQLSDEERDAAYDDLVVEFRPADAAISLLVANVSWVSTLRDTVAGVLSHLQDVDGAPNARFTKKEGICLPVIRIACEAIFDQLSHRPIANCALRGRYLGELQQRVIFQFDEGGASAPSMMRNPYGGALMSPRRWYHDAPFNLLVVVERNARSPIFACWFGNSNAFVEGPEPEESARLRRYRRSDGRSVR
ncbi:hypothetical protein [Sorangium cellulosum]|uniref:Uncharacterized protein n=1 Tax=Sorangium cellulosum TaxID=56 RepID=A0A150QTL9_SORCE|nr:hypothetical protein [Sorangium cellulosum]KYF71324.1 hypothetical protein BE15_44545 [Sorangium cellulosum]